VEPVSERRAPAGPLARRLAARLGIASDVGMTLVEVVITMLLMGLAFGLIIPSLLPLLQLMSRVRDHSTSTSDAQIVFERIDSEVRFAEAINQQGYGASAIANPDDPSVPAQKARYVEWLTPAESSPTGKELCTQWRFVPSTNAIEERQWNLDSTPPAVFTERLELAIDQPPVDATHANEDSHGRPTYPFAMSSASNANPLQSLTLWVYAGDAANDATTQIKTRMVARNSDQTAVTNDDNGSGWGQFSAAGFGDPAGYLDPTAGRRVPFVCDSTVGIGGTSTAFPASTPFRP